MTGSTVVGIDPGLHGGIAVLTATGELQHAIEMPSGGGRVLVSEICGYLSPWIEDGGIDMVVIESVHSMPRQGVASTFTFGRAFGAVEGAMEALKIPQSGITPPVWKRRLGLPTNDKDGARHYAMRRWPGFPDYWRYIGRGRALGDAACIALAWLERKQ
jgi:Holliday junction resolvasome RuvABC endonuclease subunit